MKVLWWKMQKNLQDGLQELKKDDRGIGVVEVILILVILIGLILIFKNQITSIITSALDSINTNSQAIVN